MRDPGSTAQILVAEANDALRRRVIRILRWDFRVIGDVAMGADLLDAAVALAPNVIVSNILLPDMGGLKVWKELQALGKEVPFVFLASELDITKYSDEVRAAYVYTADLPTNLYAAVRSALTGKLYLSDRYRKSRREQ
jgi:DNA-binding NarL/FixJ family response regulator